MDVRRGYKRSKILASTDAPIRPDLVLIRAIRTGEIRCPMKWGILGIEACASIQSPRCLEYGCAYTRYREQFLAEAHRVKSDPTKVRQPKLAPIQEGSDDST